MKPRSLSQRLAALGVPIARPPAALPTDPPAAAEEGPSSGPKPSGLDPRALERLRARGLLSRAPTADATHSVVREGRPSLPIEGAVHAMPGGSTFCRELWFPLDHRHGGEALGALLDCDAALSAPLGRTPAMKAVPWTDRLWFDSETTSLQSGAGVFVFLLGVGRFEAGGFALRQFLMRSPAEERATLEAFAAETQTARGLASFCGKSFDVPRTRDRFLYQDLEAHFSALPHLDLHHAARRIFGHLGPDARLQTFERLRLGFTRTDDLPGAECPAQWFAWQRGAPHRMADVLRHNAEDILSLVALERELVRAAAETEHDAEAHLSAVLLLNEGEGGDRFAARLLRAAERCADLALRPPMALRLSRALRRAGNREMGLRFLERALPSAPQHKGLLRALGRP